MRRTLIPITILSVVSWSATASAGKRFCLRLPPDNTHIYDASPRPSGFDYGEDRGRRFSGDWGLAKIYAHIETESGVAVWGATSCSGGLCMLSPTPLNTSGCTSFVDTPGGTAPEMFRIRYWHQGSFPITNSGFSVLDCSSSNPSYPTGCSSAMYVIDDVEVPAGSNVTHYEDVPMTVMNMLSWELAFTMLRFTAPGHVLVKYYDSTAANALGIGSTGTVWSSQGQPQINIVGTGWRYKYTIAHEYGHVYSVFRNASLTPSDLDYCFTTPSNCQHSLTSPEYQAAAAAEGFAQFYSVAVWNNAGLNADAFLAQPDGSSMGDSISLEFGEPGFEEKYYETQICNQLCLNGIGVELDWARAFWDFYTDYSPRPLMNSIGLVFQDIYPWPVNSLTSAYYTNFYTGVDSVLGSTWKNRFISVAQANGINW